MQTARDKRLQSAVGWVKKYSGKRIVHGYAKKYGVDKICAIKELRMIGVEISQEYENQLQQSLESLRQQRLSFKKEREDKINALSEFESDENFAMILGYTSGGFPYGVTHEEMDEINDKEQ
ncbi:MAG TPA: hypothetical protein VJY41_06380 [Prolixibacteraceae bacterium]|nr:hypothetical protein [Prolixibacteraceae bacterium]